MLYLKNLLYTPGKFFKEVNRGMGENAVLCNGEDENEATPFKVPFGRFKGESIIDVSFVIRKRWQLEVNTLSS